MSYSVILLWIFGGLFVLYALFEAVRWYLRGRLLRSIERMPFPQTYRSTLRRIGHYQALSDEERAAIERAMLRFIHTREFVGIRMRVEEEMKVAVAFFACLMVLHKEETYEGVRSVLLYADDFFVEEESENGGIVTSGEFLLDGQSTDDTVVLSWHEAERELFGSGMSNVVIHEFAHILDFEDGMADGVPLLGRAESGEWVRVMRREYEKLLHAMQQEEYPEKYDLLGEYAATDEAEFFAVGSERFFHAPRQLHEGFEELFEAMRRFYGVDPRVWFPED